MKQEKYTIFFDTGAALLPGTLNLCQTDKGLSGDIMLLGHGTTINRGEMQGDQRRFAGSIWYKEQEVPFEAEGMVNDGLLDIDISIWDQVFSLTGFPAEDKA